MGGWDNINDALQMAIMYFIHTFVLSQLGTAAIPIEDFSMLEDGRYQQFPWGQRAFTRLMNRLRQEFKSEKQMYRLNYEQPNQPFQTSNLPTSEAGNVSGVPDNSDIQKVIFDNSQLEGLKQYLKGYVDQQIGYLEELIKQNHSELMKVVGAKDNKSEKDIDGISMPYMVDDSVEKDKVDPQSTSHQSFQ
ncbi:hypothetical protein KY290_007718 [Solanum tuberosum]|uniref:DUF1985 domain-containing protein n=1 Tax=Solanum tuberosum TaxID=4113 RepID=A0ABQ7W6H4_SOLTU|nr:hypothetical protein KY290_007718 [Solanum tuberosum]